MPTLDGPRRRGRRAGTLVSGGAAALVVVALVVAATGASPTAAARRGGTTTTATPHASMHGGSGATSTSDASVSTGSGGHGGTTTTSTSPSGGGPTTGPSSKATQAPASPTGVAHGTAQANASTGTTSATTPGSGTSSAGTGLPCQGTTPLALGGNWTCTFDDEFNGSALDTSKWVPQVTATSGYLNGATACYVDNPGTVSVAGGTLDLSVRQVAPFTCSYPGGSFATSYEAGMVSTYGLFDQTYGAFEVSAKLPAAAIDGLQETMWLYPQSLNVGAPSDPAEIDFAEFFSQYPGLDVPYVHYAASSSDPDVTAYDCSLDQNSFNTYEVDWQPGTITVLYNDKTCLVDHPTTGTEPFDQPFFVALTQALGVGTNSFAASSTPLPATTQVDWVRGWSPLS